MAERTQSPLSTRGMSWLYVVFGTAGLVLSGVLLVEKIRIIEDPEYIPSCSINPILSCGSIMTTPQAEAFGFPNPILGLIGFSVVLTMGMALVGGARLPAWFWSGMLGGTVAGAAFVHWLAFQSLYRIDALCPYCIGVWVVAIALFWHTMLFVTVRWVDRRGHGRGRQRLLRLASEYHGAVLTLWYLGLLALITLRFWDYWSTLA